MFKKYLRYSVLLFVLLVPSAANAYVPVVVAAYTAAAELAAYVTASASLHIAVIGEYLSSDMKSGGKSSVNSSGNVKREAEVTWVDIVDAVPVVERAPNAANVNFNDLKNTVEKDSASKARFPNLHSALWKETTYPFPTEATPAGSNISYGIFPSYAHYKTDGPVTGYTFCSATCPNYIHVGAVENGKLIFSADGSGGGQIYQVAVLNTTPPPDILNTVVQFSDELNRNYNNASTGTGWNSTSDQNIFTDKYGAEIDDLIHAYPNIVHFDEPMPSTPSQAQLDNAFALKSAQETAAAAASTASSSSATAQSAAQTASTSAAAAAAAAADYKANPNNPYKAYVASTTAATAARDAAAAVTAASQAVKDAQAATQAAAAYNTAGGTDTSLATSAQQAVDAASAAATTANATSRQAAAAASAASATSAATAAANLRATANQLATASAASPGDATLASQAAAAETAASQAESQAAASAATAAKDAELAAAAEDAAAATARGKMAGSNAYDTSFTGLPESKSITDLLSSFVSSSPLAAMVRSFTVSTSGSVSSVSCGTFYGQEIKFDFVWYQDTFNALGGVLLIICHGFAVLIVIRGW